MALDGLQDNLAQRTFPMAFHERVLAYGMVNNKPDNTTSYQIDGSHRKVDALPEMNSGTLLEKFAKDPKNVLAYGRQNIMAIMNDPKLPKEDKIERVKRYVDAFLDLQLKLDHEAFLGDDTVRTGVPDYLPDQMTDMGSDSRVDPTVRDREKIRIDKRQVFDQNKELFYEIFSQKNFDPSWRPEQIKSYIIQRVAQYIYDKMPYNYKSNPFANMFKSVPIAKAQEDQAAVCRHHAIYTQVILQALGLTSRLLKCDVDFEDGTGSAGAHACNLVRIDGNWYMLDTTNPDVVEGKGRVYLVPLPERDIDTNRHQYVWKTNRHDNGSHYTYTSRNNMYYKINSSPLK